MSRIVLVPGGARAESERGEVIATYPTGERLIRTDAPAPESGAEREPHGLELSGVSADTITQVRAAPGSTIPRCVRSTT